MLGKIEFQPKGRGKPERSGLYGLNVLRVQVDDRGWLGERRLRQAAKRLAVRGTARVLAPRGFTGWDLLRRYGLGGLDPGPMLRSCAAPLALAALEQLGQRPESASVALEGRRVDRDMVRCAQQLCPRVRTLVVNAPSGEELAAWLRREYGIPMLPQLGQAQVSVCFGGEGASPALRAVRLEDGRLDLAGVRLRAPGLQGEDGENLPLLTALWETGRLKEQDLEFT